MRKPSKEELEIFLEFDSRVYKAVRDLRLENFKELWMSEREYRKHIQKRIDKAHIKNEEDYIRKIKDAFFNPDDIKWKRYRYDFKKIADRFDRIYYKKSDFWLDVFLENGKLVTAYRLEKDYYDILLKGNIETFEIIDIQVDEVLRR